MVLLGKTAKGGPNDSRTGTRTHFQRFVKGRHGTPEWSPIGMPMQARRLCSREQIRRTGNGTTAQHPKKFRVGWWFLSAQTLHD
jgi:hypothetical protein